MGYITEIGLTSRFFQGKGAYQLEYHKNSGTLPLSPGKNIARLNFSIRAQGRRCIFVGRVVYSVQERLSLPGFVQAYHSCAGQSRQVIGSWC